MDINALSNVTTTNYETSKVGKNTEKKPVETAV